MINRSMMASKKKTIKLTKMKLTHQFNNDKSMCHSIKSTQEILISIRGCNDTNTFVVQHRHNNNVQQQQSSTQNRTST